MARALVLAGFLLAPSAAVAPQKAQHGNLPPLGHLSLASIPMHMYKEDCHKQVIAPVVLARAQAKRRAAVGAIAKVPGAGMEPEAISPYAMVLKDGFYEIECVKDSMYEFGDKFGDGKFSYKMGDISNVSIVHYESLVPKEDREPMNHEVCFEFCRTVPDMHFFGIFNGRDCYCTPYYDAMESDSTQCDAVCEGNPTQMCGGKKKSSIFSMHSCADTAQVLSQAKDKADDVEMVLSPLATAVKGFDATLQEVGEELQFVFGSSGDPAASNLMQSAKVFAGELEKSAAKGETLAADLKQAALEVDTVAQKDFTKFANAEEADHLTKKLDEMTAEAEASVDELEELAKLANASAVSTVSEQYYPIMYFVDKEHNDTVQTCTGEVMNKPMVATSLDACAQACNNEFQKCAGFAYFPGGSGNLCFLMEKFTEVTYYTGCEAPSAFLQKANKKAAVEAKCMAKFSEFVGMNLSPDPSGKCKTCLKKATKAARCPEA